MSSSFIKRQYATTAAATESPPALTSSSSLMPPARGALPSILSLPPLLRATSTPIRFNDKDWAALVEASERDALAENADVGLRQTRRRESSLSADLPFFVRSSSSGALRSPTSSQAENDSGHDSLGDAAGSPSSDIDLSSIAGTTSASLSTPSLSYEYSAAREGSSSTSSSSGNDSLGARPKTWTRSKTIYRRDRDISRHDSGLCMSSDGSLLSPASFASSQSCIVYRGGHFLRRERFDFLRYLSEMNMDHVVEKIFSFLDAVDLCKVACTSVRWHNSLSSDSPSNLKRIDFLIDCKKNRENFGYSYCAQRLTPRKGLSILNTNYQSKTKREREECAKAANVVSPSKVRHHLFREEAAKLSPGEELQRCPRCTFPSVVDLSVSAVASCTSKSCSFTFCTRCRCGDHGADTCRHSAAAASATGSGRGTTSSATPASASSVTVASKKSRRRLKRL